MERTEKRTIRSYVLRQGRMTEAQARAIKEHWSAFGIDFNEQLLDLDAIYHRSAPRILDIGSGMGETLLEIAAGHPENDYLAVEVHRPGVGKLIASAVGKNLSNIRVINHDVIEILRHQLPANSLDEVYLFFPDPWPKKRHHKRRLVGADFLALLKPKLKFHARIFLATDWEDLAGHMLEACDRDEELINLAGTGHFAPRPAWRPLTKFENRGLKLGHPVWDLCFALKLKAKS